MHNGQRVFYTGENGDRWILVSETDDIVSVRHEPNERSGGDIHSFDIGAFLIEEPHSAQNQALRAMISSLTHIESGAAPPLGEWDTEPLEPTAQADMRIDDPVNNADNGSVVGAREK